MNEILKKPLFLRFCAVFGGLLFIAIAVSTALTVGSNNQLLKDRLREHAVTLAETVAKATSHLIQGEDISSLREVILSLNRGDGLPASALICDRQGKTLCHTRSEEDGTVTPELASVEIATILKEVHRADGSFLQVTTPLFRGAEPWGAFRAELSMAVLQREEAGLLARAFWLGVSLLALGAVGAFWLARTIITPVEQLAQAASEVSRGNFSARSGVGYSGEIGALAQAFDNMAQELSKVKREDRLHSSVLEQRVEARTQALEARTKELVDAKKLAETAQGLNEEATRSKGEILASVSQEIRTPVNSIIGMVDLVLDTQLSPEQREYVKLARESAQELMVMLKNIVHFSRLEKGKDGLLPIGFQLRDLIGDTLKLLGVQARKKGIELVCHVEAEVPDALVGDPDRVRQILLNLVGNAIKFTEKGDVFLRVERDSQASSDAGLHFAVADTGGGISKEKAAALQKVLGASAGSRTEEPAGIAPGLSLSAELVDMMGGKIWFESEAGKGSSFHFTATFGLHEDKALVPRACENCEFSGLSALVLDDNAACRRALGAMLKRWKVKADLVESSAAAWKLLEKASKAVEPYDIVLLDEDLPDTDSIVLAQRMGEKEGLFGALVVLLGSADEPQEAAHWRDLGAAACITKPVKESELFQALAESIAAVPAASV